MGSSTHLDRRTQCITVYLAELRSYPNQPNKLERPTRKSCSRSGYGGFRALESYGIAENAEKSGFFLVSVSLFLSVYRLVGSVRTEMVLYPKRISRGIFCGCISALVSKPVFIHNSFRNSATHCDHKFCRRHSSSP